MRKWNSPGGETMRGFTLLEVMVALAILAVALTTLFGSQSQSLSLALQAKFDTTAPLLAGLKGAELESGRLQPVDAEGDFGADFPGYGWRIEVRDAAAEWPELSRVVGDSLRRVDLSVTWEEAPAPYTVRYYLRSGALP